MRCESFHCSKESRLSEELFENWCEEAVEDGLGFCVKVEGTGSWHCVHRRVEVEAADGGSRQGTICLDRSFCGGE